jgi:tricorn protease
VIHLETGIVSLVDTDRYVRPERTMNPVWSPDSRWIAYAHTLDNLFKAIVVYNVETGKRIQVTDGMADAITPVWDASGKYLYFLASTNYGLNTGWLDMSSYDRPVTRALYVAVLAGDGLSPSCLAAMRSPPPRAQKSPAEPARGRRRGASVDATEGNGVTVRIDEEGLMRRIVAVDIPLRDYTGLVAGPENFVFYLEAVPNQQWDKPCTGIISGSAKRKHSFRRCRRPWYPMTGNPCCTAADRPGESWMPGGYEKSR